MLISVLLFYVSTVHANPVLKDQVSDFKRDKAKILLFYGCTDHKLDKDCIDLRTTENSDQLVKAVSLSSERKNELLAKLVKRTMTLECCMGIQDWKICIADLDKASLINAEKCKSNLANK